jgi:hypothetical protein
MSETLTVTEFSLLADRLGVPAEVREELYPMVRDLRSLADRLNRLIPDLHGEIPADALSGTGGEGDR